MSFGVYEPRENACHMQTSETYEWYPSPDKIDAWAEKSTENDYVGKNVDKCMYKRQSSEEYKEAYKKCINAKEFKQWKRDANLSEEYHYEYLNHYQYDYRWDDFDAFKTAVKKGKIKKLSEFTHKPSKYTFKTLEDALSSVRGYQSYPAFRNEHVLLSIKQDFEQNRPLARPIVVQCDEEDIPYVMSGNTRTGIAEMCGIDPEFLVIQHQDC